MRPLAIAVRILMGILLFLTGPIAALAQSKVRIQTASVRVIAVDGYGTPLTNTTVDSLSARTAGILSSYFRGIAV